MSGKNRSNVLLVEILIAVLFFMLSATVLVRVFATAKNLSDRSGIQTQALAEAQNVADALYAAEDIDACLDGMGFESSHGVWTREFDSFTIYVAGGETETESGVMWEGSVRAFCEPRNVSDDVRRQDEELFSLPCLRYREA